MAMFAPIPMPKDFGDAFDQGLTTSQSIFDSLARNRGLRAAAAAQEAKNPYVGAQAQADLTGTQNVNKYYGPLAESKMSSEAATRHYTDSETALKQQLFQHPSLGTTGTNHEIAAYMIEHHPEIAKHIAAAVSPPQQAPQQAAQQQADAIQQQNLLQQAYAAMQPKSANNMTPIPNAGAGNMPPMTPMPQQNMPPAGMQDPTQTPQAAPQPAAAPSAPAAPPQAAAKAPFDPLAMQQRNIEAEIAEKEAMAKYKANGGAAGSKGVGIQQLNAIDTELGVLHPDWDSSKIARARDAYLDGEHTVDGEELPPARGKLDDLLTQKYKNKTDQSQRAQERYADTLATTFKAADKVAPGAFKFAGAAGKIKGGVEALRAQRGEQDPEYLDYKEFVTVAVPAMASEILRTGGASSTDAQKLMAIQQANPISALYNPEMAMQTFKYLEHLYKEIGKTVSKSSNQRHADLTNDNNNSTEISAPTESAISSGPHWERSTVKDKNGKYPMVRVN